MSNLFSPLNMWLKYDIIWQSHNMTFWVCVDIQKKKLILRATELIVSVWRKLFFDDTRLMMKYYDDKNWLHFSSICAVFFFFLWTIKISLADEYRGTFSELFFHMNLISPKNESWMINFNGKRGFMKVNFLCQFSTSILNVVFKSTDTVL